MPLLWKCLAPFSRVATLGNTCALEVFALFSQVATLETTSALEVFGSFFTGCYFGKYLCSGSVWVPFHRLLLWEIPLLRKCLAPFSQSLLWETSLLWKCLAPISQVATLKNTSALEVLAPFSKVSTLENHRALEVFGCLLTGRYSGKYLCSGSVWLPFHRLLLWKTPLLWKCLWLYPCLRSMKDIYILWSVAVKGLCSRNCG